MNVNEDTAKIGSAVLRPIGTSFMMGNRFQPVFAPETGSGGGGGENPEEKPAEKEADDKTSDADKSKETPSDGGDGKKADEKPSMSDKEAELLREVMDKKGTISDLKSSVDEMKERLKAYEGIDPTEAAAALKAKKEAETAELEQKGEWDRLRERMAGEHSTEIEAKNARIAELEAKLSDGDNVIEKLTVGHAFDSSKFISDELLLTPSKARVIYNGHFEIEDGNVVAYDKQRGATERTKLVDSKGNPVGFDDAMKKLVEADPDRDSLFRSKIKQGADSKTMDRKAPEKAPDLSSKDKIAAGLADLNKNAGVV